MHGEEGQATVEWVALVLTAALVLAAGAALAGREGDRGLGEEVAERISRTAAGTARSPDAAALAPERAAPLATRAASPASAPPASAPRAVDAFRRLRGVADVARHTWIVCLGYRRWRYELEHPMAPTEALPLDEALGIVNTCFNPHGYLLED